METFWFFLHQFRQAYDSACDSDSRFSQGPKSSYVSAYDSDSDSVASEPVYRRLWGGVFCTES